jgi:DNA polymerase III alpha subunit
MALIINATEETVTVQVAGNYFTFKPGQKKTIRNEGIARFIATEKRGCGLAVIEDLISEDEENGDAEVTEEQIEERKAKRKELEAAACAGALKAYLDVKRDLIKNNQVSLARDLARADYKHGAEHEISEGELEAMRVVARYERKGKDANEERLKEVEKLKKQIAGK